MQVFVVWKFLKLFPLGLQLLLFLLFPFLLETILDILNFLVAVLFGHLDLFDEVVRLKNSFEWFRLNDISIDHFVIRKYLLSNNISNINNTALVLIAIIIKEDMLSSVVSLINEEELGSLSTKVFVIPLFPMDVVIVNGQCVVGSQDIIQFLELSDRLLEHFKVLVLLCIELIL